MRQETDFPARSGISNWVESVLRRTRILM